MTEFTEVADRVWVARHPWFDLNVTCVGGTRGVLVVDTHASERAARDVLDAVRAIGAGEVVGVVNTHEHFDHTFGNIVFREAFPQAPIHAHEVAAERTVAAGERMKAEYAASDDPADAEHAAEVIETRILPAEVTFSSAFVVDLGDRSVELVHPGPGHSPGDLVVRVPDADALLAGDLVEESAPPAYGVDCHPLDWPRALDLVLQLIGPDTVVVPGHGALVDRAFVHDQRADIGIVAETIRDLASRGVPVAEALAGADWPFPREGLAHAVTRGYAHLPSSQKRLPLV
jgi:glyoxylase-like metal-dependent hydrolase (beta-lactamase superfamily II)